MTSWRDEYIQALNERDERERAGYERIDEQLIDAYTKLLDRTAALEAEKAANISTNQTFGEPTQSPLPTEGNAQLRRDLTDALRSKGLLLSKLKNAEADLAKLKAKASSDSKLIEGLSKERALLSQKVRDRAEELRGKAKLFHDVQDEMISLNLQLNMAEQKTKKLEVENQELIDRWMARMGHEADEMNKTLND